MAFRPYVPDYTPRLLAGGGAPPFVRRAEAAVLIADVAGFTPMSASLAAAGPYGAEELSDLLNAVFDRVTILVGGYGGTVAKFAGDAVTAVFPAGRGLPVAARRAVQCALDLQAAMGEFRAVATRAGPFTLAMRAGVGAGSALLAVLGDQAIRLEHLVAGEALDRAAAAARRSGPGEVAVDGALAASLGVEVAERRGPAAVVAALARRQPRPARRGPVALDPHEDERLAAFLHPAIAERVRRGQAGLVNEHRTVTMAFIGFPELAGDPFRMGVTTGVVWCGEVGSGARREYAVVGDSVNLAARLMEAAAPGQLLIDRPTWERASGAAVGRRLPVTVKGRSGTVDVWAVEGMRDRADPPDRAAPPALVNRRVELARLEAAVRRLAAGRGGVIGLLGEPGISKSRLAAETVALAGELGVGVWGGACRSLGTARSYLVWRSVWHGLLGLDRAQSLDEQRAALFARLGERAPLLAPVLNLPLPDTRLTARLDPPTRAELLRSLLLDLLREQAAAAPVLLVLEDCHWMDGPSRALL